MDLVDELLTLDSAGTNMVGLVMLVINHYKCGCFFLMACDRLLEEKLCHGFFDVRRNLDSTCQPLLFRDGIVDVVVFKSDVKCGQ